MPLGASTDADGFYYIINVPPGHYVLEAMMIGYATQRILDVKVESDRTIKINFALKETILESEVVTVIAEKEVVKLDVASSEAVISGSEIGVLPVHDVSEVLGLTAGVNVDRYNNAIEIRGGGSDQVAAYVDGFQLKDEVFNTPQLSFNTTSIEYISIKTGGFSAEYGDLRSGVIEVDTKDGGDKYSLIVDSRYSFAGYKYDGPKKYTEDKNWLMYGSDWSMDSTRLRQEFDSPYDTDFDGWQAYTKLEFGKDSLRFLTANQRKELWNWRHRGREEGHLPDYTTEATLTGPVPFINNLNFMLSYRDQNDAYAHPAVREYFKNRNGQLKLSYNINPNMKLTVMGMYSHQMGMTQFDNEGGNAAFVQRTGGGGHYINTNTPIGDVISKNMGINFKHVLSENTFYEVRASHSRTEYDLRPGKSRNYNKVKYIDPEYYIVEEGDTLTTAGFWDPETEEYYNTETTYLPGDSVYCPGQWFDEGPQGWMRDPLLPIDNREQFNIGSQYSTSTENSSAWTNDFRADFTHQANKYHMIKGGLSFKQSGITRDWTDITSYDGKWIKINYTSKPLYYAGYLQDRIEMEGLTATLGFRAELFDANDILYFPDDPHNALHFKDYYWSKEDSIATVPTRDSEKYFRLSPRLGISHPLTETSKLFFNYGHAYNAPSNSLRYAFRPKEHNNEHPQWFGNPDLKPNRTIHYELGYEIVLLEDYLMRGAMYFKDAADQSSSGNHTNYRAGPESGFNSSTYYYTWLSGATEEIFGLEFTLFKRVGQFVTGWIKTEFTGKKSGNLFLKEQYVEGDPLKITYERGIRSYPDDRMWDWQPSIQANINFRTPENWGPAWLGYHWLDSWQFNVVVDWRSGSEFTWNPDGNPNVYNNMQYADHFMLDFYISKSVKILDSKLTFYCDIHNPFNRDLLNIGLLRGENYIPGTESYRYLASLKSGDRVGDYEQSYLDYDRTRPGELDIYKYGGPMQIFFGLKFNFDWE